MTYTISKSILIDDCCLLFDSEIINYVDFLDKLSPGKLRSAYRKKAFATHPDRSQALGKNREKLDKCFKEMSTAYKRLDSIIQGEKKYIIKDEVPKKRKTRSASRSTPVKKTKAPKQAKEKKQTNSRKQTKSTSQTETTKQKSSTSFSFMNSARKACSMQMTLKTQTSISDRYFTGNVPRRELLIGQFLYYSGLISWNALNQAIVWQRRQRPIIGKIALDWGILSAEDIQRIMKERSYKDHFGEYAHRNGYITKFQHLAIVGKQKNLQPPIGSYFIEHGLLGNYDIKKMTECLKIHNRSNKRPTRTTSQ